MERIALRTQFSARVNWDEVREVLSSALRNETEQYQMSSEEFMQQFESGALGDDADYMFSVQTRD